MAGSNPVFNSTTNQWERASELKSVTIDVPDPTQDDNIPLFRAKYAGYVVGAYVHPRATLAAGTANFYQIGIVNGGTAAAASGTVIISPQVGGTAAGGTAPGWTADTSVALPASGTATFVAGEAIVLDYDETGTVAPDISVQVDFRYYA